MKKRYCKKCGQVDFWSSESEAYGICAACLYYLNRWTP